VIEADHPERYPAQMRDEETELSERAQGQIRERELADRLRAQLESPELSELLEALPTDEERDAARRETARQWMGDNGMDPHEMAVLNRLIAEQREADGTESGGQMAEFLRLAADELDHLRDP